jgi:hypothetical protein
MSKTSPKGAAFLQALSQPTEEPAAANVPKTKAPAPPPSRAAGRSGLKHIGGYFDRADVEKFAVLRARLGLDNSQLIKLAIDELHKKHEAKRAFGDV